MESYRYEVTVYERKEGGSSQAIYNQSVNDLNLLAIINVVNYDNRMKQLQEEEKAEVEQIYKEDERERWWEPNIY